MAVETSTKQMALTRDTGPGGFMERVTGILASACTTILGEPTTTAFHQQRAFFAQTVVKNPQQAATLAGPQVVFGINVINTTTYDEIEKKATCTILDLDLQSQILNLWNSLAGIDSGS